MGFFSAWQLNITRQNLVSFLVILVYSYYVLMLKLTTVFSYIVVCDITNLLSPCTYYREPPEPTGDEPEDFEFEAPKIYEPVRSR